MALHSRKRTMSDYIRLASMLIALSMLFMLIISGAVSAQVDSTELIKLQHEMTVQRMQIDSLKAASGKQLSNIEYLNKTDSAGLWSNPHVQKQINSRIEEANEVFVQDIMLWIIGFAVAVLVVIGILFGLIILKLLALMYIKYVILYLKTEKVVPRKDSHFSGTWINFEKLVFPMLNVFGDATVMQFMVA